MSYNIFDIVVLLGSIQGFITSFIFLLGKKYASQRSLGWILLLLSLACLNIYLLNTLKDFSDALIVLSYVIPLIVIMPIGPLLYQKTLSDTSSHQKLSRLHFQAIWVDILPNILAIVFFVGLWVEFFRTSQFVAFDRFTEGYNKYADIPRWISLSVYSVLSYRAIKNGKSRNQKNSKKLIFGFLMFQVVWLLYLIPYLIPTISSSLLEIFNWYPLYIPLVFLIYWLGINGLIDFKRSSNIAGTDPDMTAQVLASLNTVMEKEKLYLNPQLRLDNVVSITEIPQKTISAVLNQALHKSFNEYVNEFRIEEVKKRLHDSSNDHLTLTGIALDSGFNSQATFQRTFKDLVGESPSTFRNRKKN